MKGKVRHKVCLPPPGPIAAIRKVETIALPQNLVRFTSGLPVWTGVSRVFRLLSFFEPPVYGSCTAGASGASAFSACACPPATRATSQELCEGKPSCRRTGGSSPAPRHLLLGKATLRRAGLDAGAGEVGEWVLLSLPCKAGACHRTKRTQDRLCQTSPCSSWSRRAAGNFSVSGNTST